jgi:hypothetical protein
LVQDLYGSEETKSFVWRLEAHFHASVRTDSDVGLAALPYIQGISQTEFPVLQSAQKHLFWLHLNGLTYWLIYLDNQLLILPEKTMEEAIQRVGTFDWFTRIYQNWI